MYCPISQEVKGSQICKSSQLILNNIKNISLEKPYAKLGE